MPFITKKKINNQEYYYLRTSKRTGNKVKAITLAYLGKNKDEAILKARKIQSKTLKPSIPKENIMKEKTEKPKTQIIDIPVDCVTKKREWIDRGSKNNCNLIIGNLSIFEERLLKPVVLRIG